MNDQLVLGSLSPRRKELFSKVADSFQIAGSEVKEQWERDAHPTDVAVSLAMLKALAVADKLQGGIVLAADTLIDLSGEILGKPTNQEDASRILKSLRNRSHSVITGLAVLRVERVDEVLCEAVSTEVWMKDYPETVIESYIRSGEPMDKAGAYAIQGVGGDLVASICGCFNNVVGLPLCEVSRLLKRIGLSSIKPVDCLMPSGDLCPRIR